MWEVVYMVCWEEKETDITDKHFIKDELGLVIAGNGEEVIGDEG